MKCWGRWPLPCEGNGGQSRLELQYYGLHPTAELGWGQGYPSTSKAGLSSWRSWRCHRTRFPSPGERLKQAWSLCQSAGAAITKCHRPGSLVNRNLFLVVLEAGKSKILEDLVPDENALAHRQLSTTSHGGKGEGTLWGLVYEGSNPPYESRALMT